MTTKAFQEIVDAVPPVTGLKCQSLKKKSYQKKGLSSKLIVLAWKSHRLAFQPMPHRLHPPSKPLAPRLPRALKAQTPPQGT